VLSSEKLCRLKSFVILSEAKELLACVINPANREPCSHHAPEHRRGTSKIGAAHSARSREITVKMG
jgi:hypothetical protein